MNKSTSSGSLTSGTSKKKQKIPALEIDTASASDSKQQQRSQTPSAAGGAATTPTTQQDTHPYPRGSVIEVWHIPKHENEENEDDWWSDSDSEQELDNQDAHSHQNHPHKTIRLCDVIDRAQHQNNTWRYYVHYRDFNRRMDEWIGMDRIVSPPSVGNAKARALKKKEEKRKRHDVGRADSVIDWTAPRSRRRTSAVPMAGADGPDGTTAGAATGGATAGATAGETASGRRTRLSRRKSTVIDDDATVVASNEAAGAGATTEKSDEENDKSKARDTINKKEIVSISTDAVTTHKVGEHVLATVKAQELDEHEGLDEASLREHEEVTKVKNVSFIELGQFQMETWYYSPLPKELLGPGGCLEVLYVCEFTFNLFARKSELRRFQARLPAHKRHPPGNEIYRNGNVAMFEVDGLQEKIYCQNLCYIAKLFLDHKTLFFDVDPFLFYVLCEVDDRGFHPVGYYSKEKYSDVGYNLACILTFPAHQRKGYGRFLIAFSYELSKKEEKVGSPEKPMSDLGQQAYKPYWASTIIDFLLSGSDESSLSIMDISKKTSIMAEDIVFTLNQLGILKIINGTYFIAAEKNLLEGLAKKYPIKEPRVDPSKLHWTPFLTDVKRDKFSIHSKKASVEDDGTMPSSTS